jgi:hypothetical protein
MMPLPATLGRTALRIGTLEPMVGAVLQAVSTLPVDAGSAGSWACPRALVVATGVLLGRTSWMLDAVAAFRKHPISRILSLSVELARMVA